MIPVLGVPYQVELPKGLRAQSFKANIPRTARTTSALRYFGPNLGHGLQNVEQTLGSGSVAGIRMREQREAFKATFATRDGSVPRMGTDWAQEDRSRIWTRPAESD